MRNVWLSDHQILEIARSVVTPVFAGSDSQDAPLSVAPLRLDSDPEVWAVEILNPSGARVDPKATLTAQAELAIAISKTGDPRLFVLSQRFRGHAADAA